jgi:hypothetical protein
MNTEQTKAGNGRAVDAALEASLAEAIETVNDVETTFVSMLVSMGDSMQALMGDLYRLENGYFAEQQALKERYLMERRGVEAKLARIAKALGAR